MSDSTALAKTKQELAKDLAKSGINQDDLFAHLAGPPELAACKIRLFQEQELSSPGYVIPYFGFDGKRVPFYRVRIFNPLPGRAKYLQPTDTSTYLYFPPTFSQQVKDLVSGAPSKARINGFQPALIICEGEKKAAKAAKEGFLAVGLGGVYNWKSRSITLPAGVKLQQSEHDGSIHIKLPSMQDQEIEDIDAVTTNNWALGMREIIGLVLKEDLNVIIAFDTDFPEKPQVQKAAATLAFELRSAGIPLQRIRQLKLPAKDRKVALDDYLVEEGADGLTKVMHDVLGQRCAFPSYPNMREYVNNKLKRPISRQEAKELSAALLADMDTNGQRLKDKDVGTPYYFDNRTKKLMKVSLMKYQQEPLHETSFGRHLFRNYDLSQADSKLLPWLAASFTGEEPVWDVRPYAVMTLPSIDRLAFQLGDGIYALVTADPKNPLTIRNNGDDGIMFKGDQVDELDPKKVVEHFHAQKKFGLKSWWLEALKEFKFVREQDRMLASILFYVSPWLLRWNGTQLPVELMVGEPGSGKSSMYMLRMSIMTGRPALRNQPADIRDWYSSVTATDGLHVVDNVHFVSKDIRQRLSDEMCRLVTEPDPYIELRKLYTTSDNYRIPVRNVFAMTAIQQPFNNADIIQRSAIFNLGAIGGSHDSDWVGHHLKARGGREAWVAHHLLAIHEFLKAAVLERQWDYKYKSGHRLVNYEQSLSLMGKILGVADGDTVKKEYIRNVDEQVSEYDWTMEGLKEYAEYALPLLQRDPNKFFTCTAIVEWCQAKEDYRDNQFLSNPRRLARYLKSHQTMVEKVTGIYDTGVKRSNRDTFRVKFVHRDL